MVNAKPRTKAPTMAPTMQEIASIANGRDITRGFVEGLLLYPQDRILQKLGWDYARYEAILTDDQVESCLQQRRTALLSREWEVEPGGEKRIDKQAAEFVKQELKRIRWDAITEKMHYGVFYGFAVGECMWNREDDKIHLDAIKVRKQRRFRFGPEKDLRLLTLANMLRGEELPPQKFWSFTTGADNDDEPYGLGLGHWLYWPTLFKRGGWKAWLMNLQKTAGPTGLGKYQPGASEAEQKKLLQAVGAIQTEAGVILPEGMSIELLQSARTATADYGALDEACNAAISKVILSQTMTTDNGSSLSQAEVHAGVAAAVVKSDADLINESFNSSVVQWLTDWNFPEAAYPKVWREMSDAEDLNDRSSRDKTLFDMGFRLTPEKLQEVYGEGYVDPATLQEEGEEERPPLVTLLGVGGTQALMTFFGQLPQLGLSTENASAILENVFGITPEAAQAMLPQQADPADPNASVDPNAAPGQPAAAPAVSLDQAAALFGEAVEFAAKAPGKKKNCTKGISCGGSCISAKKACVKTLSATQKQRKAQVAGTPEAASPSEEAAANAGQDRQESRTGADSESNAFVQAEKVETLKSELEKKFGAEELNQAEENMQRLIDESDVFFRIQDDAFIEDAIDGGRFKNAFDPGVRPPEYLENRSEVEQELFGIDAGDGAANRPTYAYLGSKTVNLDDRDHSGAAQYGDVIVRLKGEVKDRSTVSNNDTWTGGMPSSLNQVSAATLAGARYDFAVTAGIKNADERQNLQSARSAKSIADYLEGSSSPYLEVHVHKGAKPSDVGELIYTKGKRPSAKVEKWAKENGVKISIED